MEITPVVFEESDRYHQAMAAVARRLVSSRHFGLLPQAPFQVDPSSEEGGTTTVTLRHLEAVTPAGDHLWVDGADTTTIPIPNTIGAVCYITIRREGSLEQETNGIPYERPRHVYDACALEHIGPDSLPIVKLVRNASRWNIQNHYLPPLAAMSANEEMTHLLRDCVSTASAVVQTLAEHHPSLDTLWLQSAAYDLRLLTVDDTPHDLYRMLARLVHGLKLLNLPETAECLGAELPRFNNNDILDSITPLQVALVASETALKAAPKPEKKPETKPETKPEKPGEEEYVELYIDL